MDLDPFAYHHNGGLLVAKREDEYKKVTVGLREKDGGDEMVGTGFAGVGSSRVGMIDMEGVGVPNKQIHCRY